MKRTLYYANGARGEIEPERTKKKTAPGTTVASRGWLAAMYRPGDGLPPQDAPETFVTLASAMAWCDSVAGAPRTPEETR